jgi:hypothetical protein
MEDKCVAVTLLLHCGAAVGVLGAPDDVVVQRECLIHGLWTPLEKICTTRTTHRSSRAETVRLQDMKAMLEVMQAAQCERLVHELTSA